MIETREFPELAGQPIHSQLALIRAFQERCWRCGEPRSAESLLELAPEVAADPESSLIVVLGEYLIRHEAGDVEAAHDLLKRFPSLADRLREQIEFQHALDAESIGRSLDPTTPMTNGVPRSSPLPDIEIVRELGRGGMGVVLLGRQKKLGRFVAVKTMSAGLFATPEARLRFQLEAEVLARLNHPNIVKVHEVHEWDGLPCLVLEYVSGGTLRDAIREKRFPQRSAAELVETLALAIHAAHREGVVHRDLKPGNVLLDDSGVPKISDFGLAKRVVEGADELTATGAVFGTPAYMAPEQAGNVEGVIGPPTDVYALGAVLYEMIAGKPPFRGPTPLETLKLAATSHPPSLKGLAPADLGTIIGKCLEKPPSARYSTALELADDLRRWLDDRPIKARAASPLERLWRWRRRNPLVAGLIASILVLSPAALVALSVLYVRAEFHRGQAERNETIAKNRTAAAQDVVHDMLGEFSDLLAQTQDTEQVRRALALRAVRFYEGLAEEPDSSTPRFRIDHARAYQALAEVQRTSEEFEAAEANFQKAIGLFEVMTAQDGLDPRIQADLAWLHVEHARFLDVRKRWPAAVDALTEAERIYAVLPATKAEREGRAYVHRKLGEVLAKLPGRRDDAIASFGKAVGLQREIVKDFLDDGRNRAVLGSFLVAQAGAHAEANRPAEVDALLDQAFAALVQRKGDGPQRVRLEAMQEALSLRGSLAEKRNDLPKALEHHRQAILTAEALIADFPKSFWFRERLGQLHLKFAEVVLKANAPDSRSQAVIHVDLAIDVCERLRKEVPGRVSTVRVLEDAKDARRRLEAN